MGKRYPKIFPRKALLLIPRIVEGGRGDAWRIERKIPCVLTRTALCGGMPPGNMCSMQKTYKSCTGRLCKCPGFVFTYLHREYGTSRSDSMNSCCALFFHIPPIPKALTKKFGRGSMIRNTRGDQSPKRRSE